jgi:nucleotide-binding universal stress UspA family protein
MKRILLAYDGTDVDRHALTTTIELAKAFDADVAVVGVVELMPARVGGTMPWDEERHADDLDEAVAALRAAGIEAEAVLHPAGRPAATIEAIAARGRFDTIVVGHRHLSAVERLVEPIVATHVATHSDSTVVIVH